LTPPGDELDSASGQATSSDPSDLIQTAKPTVPVDSARAEASEQSERMGGDGLGKDRLGLDGTFERLAPQQVKFEQRIGYFVAAVLILAAVVGSLLAFVSLQSEWWFLPAFAASWVLFLGGCVFYSHFWPQIQYQYTGYRLGDAGMEILRGVFWRHKISIPLARVQHVDVSQGPVQRIFDLGTLAVHTAGTKNASIELAGLAHAKAVQLRDQLIEQRETLDVT
jgi:membrane protein YdbS with pleckstrin-like domain